MPRHSHVTKFFIISFGLHALLIAAFLLLIRPEERPPSVTPVDIVNLPPQDLKQLPPLRRPAPPVPPPPVRPMPEKRLSPSQVPKPKKFGPNDEITLPKTQPPAGKPKGAEQGAKEGKEKGGGPKPSPKPGEKGPLPFLTWNEIDELARRGMPERKPGDDSVTLDTDEFKFMSYNRWLKIKIESELKYPELAAVSGYQGALYIKFDIMKDGSLGGLELLKSSGYKILDDEGLRAIRDSAPFQPLPEEWHRDRYSIRAAVVFYLGSGYVR